MAVWRRLAFCLGLGLALGLPLRTAVPPPGQVGFQSYGKPEGLTNLSATALAQDDRGLLWAGTDHGLFRLEGGRFHRVAPMDGLPTPQIVAMAPGASRGLWIYTRQGLVYWNGRVLLPPSALGLKGLDQAQGWPLAQGGAVLEDPRSRERFLSLDGEPFQALAGLPPGGAFTAGTCLAARDLLVLALGRELWVRRKGAWSHRDLARAVPSAIKALWIDDKDRILLRSDEFLGRLAAVDGPLESLPAPRLTTTELPGLGVDAEGRIWTNTAEGLVWVKGDRAGFIGERAGLPQGGAFVMAVDRQGVLWIGGEGVHKLQGEGRWTGYTRREGLPAELVLAIARPRDGRTWVGTAGGLAVSGDWGWQALPGTRSSQFFALAEDGAGNLWAGHTASRERPTVLSVRPAGSRSLVPVPLPVLPAPTRVRSILCDGDTLWLGTSEGGLLKATRAGAGLAHLEQVAIGAWPQGNTVYQVAGDGAGGLWVVSRRGAAHWDGHAWATLDKASGLPNDMAPAVAALPGKAAWVATMDPISLCRLRRVADRLDVEQILKAPHPMVRQPVLSLAVRPDGALWAGTSTGLLRWDGQRITRFGKDTGFPGEDCSQGALCFDADGDPWVGLSVGLVHGDLKGFSDTQAPPATVLLEALRGDGRSLLDPATPREVPWGIRTMTFNYCPKGTSLPEGVTYQVRLPGLEEAWRDTSLAEARYPGLTPGRYRFEVRAVAWTGEPGPAQALAFRVLPPWWLHPASLVVIVLGLVAGGVVTVRWRTALLTQRNLQLEALVAERTRALSEANLALEEASLIDPLTTLRNRRFLQLAVQGDALRAQRTFREALREGRDPRLDKEAMLFFLFDLDHFKEVNDRWGHAAGDAVLVQFSERLKAVTRASDTLVRWGGEEFLLVTRRTRPQDAAAMAETLLAAARARPYLLPGGETLPVTCSFGLVAFPMHPGQPDLGSWQQAVDLADQCLYAAKHSGRDRWVAAFIEPGAPRAPFEDGAAWNVAWAVREGLMTAQSSQGEVTWKG